MLPDIQYIYLNSKIQFSLKFNRKASNSPPSTAPLARVSLALEPAEASVNPGGITESPTRGRNPLTEDEQRVVAAQNTRAKINEGIFSLAHMGHRDEKVRKVDTKQHTHTQLLTFLLPSGIPVRSWSWSVGRKGYSRFLHTQTLLISQNWVFCLFGIINLFVCLF